VNSIKFLDKDQREAIGFNFILEELDVTTPYGVDKKKRIKVFKKNEKAELINELNNVEKIVESIKDNKEVYIDMERLFCKFKDIRNSLKRCREFIVLDEVELYELKNFSIVMEELIDIYKNINLDIDNIKFSSLRDIISLLDPENMKIHTFYIYDSYSEALKNIRNEKRIIEEKIFKEFDEDKIKILKEKRLDIVLEEEKEELNIKKYLSEKIRSYIDLLETNIKSLGELDFLIGKGKLALKFKGSRPSICDGNSLYIEDSFNPYIQSVLSKKGKEFTPVSISLQNGVSVITGANMGGKSVTLKTIVLNLLLAQSGFFVFAHKIKFSMLDFIYFISDDMQSISKGLSTFGAEIVKLKEVIECVKREDGFVALDEFARGTNPKEGYFLVKSLTKYLNDFNTISLISTHYDGVVQDDIVHYQVVGLKNVNFDSLRYKIDLNKSNSIEIIQEHMDYKLEKVCANNMVPKDALNISILLGLEKSIVDIAKNFYETGDEYAK
jgi:dsDNA-specific endonuclease/ATPase MutS2